MKAYEHKYKKIVMIMYKIKQQEQKPREKNHTLQNNSNKRTYHLSSVINVIVSTKTADKNNKVEIQTNVSTCFYHNINILLYISYVSTLNLSLITVFH